MCCETIGGNAASKLELVPVSKQHDTLFVLYRALSYVNVTCYVVCTVQSTVLRERPQLNKFLYVSSLIYREKLKKLWRANKAFVMQHVVLSINNNKKNKIILVTAFSTSKYNAN